MDVWWNNHFLYKDLVHHPIETSIYKWLALGFHPYLISSCERPTSCRVFLGVLLGDQDTVIASPLGKSSLDNIDPTKPTQFVGRFLFVKFRGIVHVSTVVFLCFPQKKQFPPPPKKRIKTIRGKKTSAFFWGGCTCKSYRIYETFSKWVVWIHVDFRCFFSQNTQVIIYSFISKYWMGKRKSSNSQLAILFAKNVKKCHVTNPIWSSFENSWDSYACGNFQTPHQPAASEVTQSLTHS